MVHALLPCRNPGDQADGAEGADEPLAARTGIRIKRPTLNGCPGDEIDRRAVGRIDPQLRTLLPQTRINRTPWQRSARIERGGGDSIAEDVGGVANVGSGTALVGVTGADRDSRDDDAGPLKATVRRPRSVGKHIDTHQAAVRRRPRAIVRRLPPTLRLTGYIGGGAARDREDGGWRREWGRRGRLRARRRNGWRAWPRRRRQPTAGGRCW